MNKRYEAPEQGGIVLSGKISKFTPVSGKKGAPIRIEVLVPDEGDNAKLIDDMRGVGIGVHIQGPFEASDDAENPDQMQLGDQPEGDDN